MEVLLLFVGLLFGAAGALAVIVLLRYLGKCWFAKPLTFVGTLDVSRQSLEQEDEVFGDEF